MSCNVLNMSFFDIFHELKVCTKDGDIRQNYEENFEGILLGDRLKQVLLWEEYEDIEAWDTIHQDKYQQEFIFKLFQHIAVGGSVCQYEDNIGEYLACVKDLYKDLVSVAKDPDTQEIKCFSYVFRIDSIEGYDKYLYRVPDHPQNCFYVAVDPINWHANFFYHKWVPHW
uniref:Cilia- and flagella-associated protein 300 n=1 Tax=Strombidium inclinatum TaxID=197538 RepID=A0A7S3ISM7_9SPIT|mmetsp:Transcript_33199/g.50884  ORF Transcript_33199/g.50884 Transcript_33199/m.50884 type:complete len:170 (+) Transcript_33199:391-900(+)